MSRLSRIAVLSIVTLLLPTTAPRAAIEDGMWTAILYAGLYFPGPGALGDDATLGVRIGHNVTKHLTVAFSVGLYESEQTFDDGVQNGKLDLNLTTIEGSIWYNFMTQHRFSPSLGGGIGGGFVSAQGRIDGPGSTRTLAELVDDSLTAHADVGASLRVAKNLSLRMNSRWRWFTNRGNDEIDGELTLGLLYVWGRAAP